jgi:YhfC intramembrane metalloprotease
MIDEVNDSTSGLKQLILVTPFYLLIPAAFILFASSLNTQASYIAMAWGAGGWLIAYFLRVPVSLITRKLGLESGASQNIVISFSGILEEIVRFAILFSIGRSFAVAYFVGVGWATIEVVYAIVNAYIVETIMRRNDPEALKIQDMLREMGMIHDLGVFIGLSERVFASMFHIGMTLSIAKWPWFLPIAIVLHSLTNLTVAKLQKSNVFGSQGIIALAGIAIFFVGLKI